MEPCTQNEINRCCQQQKSGVVTVSKMIYWYRRNEEMPDCPLENVDAATNLSFSAV